MGRQQYHVNSILAAVKWNPASMNERGRFKLGVIPAGATIEIQGDSLKLSGMIEAVWNGQTYVVFPAELREKAQPIAA